ncbi:aminomethyl-transferring glycine dehydrogenase subunit GcvPA [Hydrogenobacter hydrogenophilus]|uniref:Probable glycine dehydrogenase (decarboxylating) subunit 1 n=1 Tax=Hydrogenobacter hydrogenophilus TaxID=35835 RepID=A0A285P563_9AQUI|nr:aminomethyl-transferring glycine dehydrogenase subunit GcvPA [Hydrogenobacter hydrogenophilus]SNZ15296.1 glycine dehydrogenase (decarboxylating) alpha subunit [Hydrogenobacter hydrogenophilus]
MYIPHSKDDVQKALEQLGLSSLDDLFSHIDLHLLEPPSLGPPMTEEDVRRYFKEISKRNRELVCFAGFGAYDRIIPSAIWQILSRGEFLTAYTPYQAEASQGTLQAIFEYQTLICELTGMDVANASMYDGASALASAILMARAIKSKGSRVLLSEGINPLYREVVKTYLLGYQDEINIVPLQEGGYTDIDVLEDLLKKGEVHAVAVQYPNFLGFIEPLEEIGKIVKGYQVPFVVVADPIALSVLRPPGDYGADIVVGEGQQMGLPLNFGGPYVGFFAVKTEHLRKMPGRLVGLAEDVDGKRAFTLVLQTREQHIRRERATSNICTNQNLMALANLIYMVLLGKEGMREVARQSISKAMYLKGKLVSLGFEELYKGKHLWEFPLRKEKVLDLHKRLLEKGYMFGVPLEKFGYRDTLLLAITEKRTKREMDELVHLVKEEL